MSTKAFGRFRAGEDRSLRSFEIYLKIGARQGAGAWQSDFRSVQNLLNHLKRYTQSESSKEKYLRHLTQFCQWSRHGPEELVQLPKENAESSVQEFADELASKSGAKAYVNTVIKRLRTFFRVNGYTGDRELRVRTYFVPTRYRKVPEYIPTKEEAYSMGDAAGSQKNRAIILSLWSSGLRVSTLCALDYGDVAEEVEQGEPHVLIPVYSEMKERVPDACKGRISYYTFICPAAGEALRTYLRERREKYGDMAHHDPLFYSDWTHWNREERSQRRLGRRGVGKLVKQSARLAGLAKWRYVCPIVCARPLNRSLGVRRLMGEEWIGACKSS